MCTRSTARALARALTKIKPNNAQREYYLTDAVLEIASHAGLVRLVELEDENEAMGVNSLRSSPSHATFGRSGSSTAISRTAWSSWIRRAP